MLESEFGHDVIQSAQEFVKICSLNLKITYVLVSSSEERDVPVK